MGAHILAPEIVNVDVGDDEDHDDGEIDPSFEEEDVLDDDVSGVAVNIGTVALGPNARRMIDEGLPVPPPRVVEIEPPLVGSVQERIEIVRRKHSK